METYDNLEIPDEFSILVGGNEAESSLEYKETYYESKGMTEVRGQCNCGCHYIKRNGGPTPEEFKAKMSAIAAMEGAV